MNTKDFERKLAWWTGWNDSEIDQRIRPLRRGGTFQRGAGRHSPDVTAQQAALMVLQLVSRRASEAGEIAKATWQLRAVVPPAAPKWLLDAVSDHTKLPDFLTSVFDPQSAVKLDSLNIDVKGTFAWATVTYDGARRPLYFTDLPASQTAWVQAFPERYEGVIAGFIGQTFNLGSQSVDRIVETISEAAASTGGSES